MRTRHVVIAASLAFTLFSGSAFVAPSASGAEVVVSEEAKGHFQAGVNHLSDPGGARYEEAYREFRTAYDLSSSPRILGNIGLCAMKLERDAEAVEAYGRYLAEVSDIDGAEREQIQRDLSTLKTGLVKVTVTVRPADAVVIDTRQPVKGDAVINQYGARTRAGETGRVELGVRPGRHSFKARVPGRESAPVEIDARPGGSYQVTLQAPAAVVAMAPTSSSSGPGALPWVVTGLGVLGLTAGATTGVLALSEKSKIDSACTDKQCPAGYDLEAQKASAGRLVMATDILLIGGGALTAAGALWLLLASSKAEAAPAPAVQTTASARPEFACGPTGCMAALKAAF